MLTVLVVAGAIILACVLAYLFLVNRGADAGPREGAAPVTPKPEAALPPAAPRRSASARDEDDDPDGGTTLASDPPPPSGELLLDTADIPVDVSQEEDEGPSGRILVTAAAHTDTGRRRKHNEDAFVASDEDSLFVIADGMGGYAAGEVASQLAVEEIAAAHRAARGTPDSHAHGPLLIRAIQRANATILAQARANEAQQGMGTTVISARFSDSKRRVTIAHVGDSRCYRIRDGVMTQLTTDHTLGALGITGPSAAKLSRAVGIVDEIDVELTTDEPHPGDLYMLCSDGLFKMVPEDDARDIVRSDPDLDKSVRKLVDEANARGGKDNVTIILVRVEERS